MNALFNAALLKNSGALLPARPTDLPSPPPGPSTLTKLEGLLNSTKDSGLMGLISGMAAASAPHRLPVPIMSVIGQGLEQAQAMRHAALSNAIQQAILPMKQVLGKGMERVYYGKAPIHRPEMPKGVPGTAQPKIKNVMTRGQQQRQMERHLSFFNSLAGATSLAEQEALAGMGRRVGLSKVYQLKPGQAVMTGSGQITGSVPDIERGQQVGRSGAPVIPQKEIGEMAALSSIPPAVQSQYTPQKVTGPLGTQYVIPKGQALGMPLAAGLAQARALAGRGALTPFLPPGAAPPGTSVAPSPTGASPGMPVQMQGAPGYRVGLSPALSAGLATIAKTETGKGASMIQEGAEAQQNIGQVNEAIAAFTSIKSGPGAEQVQALHSLFDFGNRFFGVPAPKIGDVTSAQVLNKIKLQYALSLAGGAGQHAEKALDAILHGVPSISNTESANSILAGNMLALARYRIAGGKFANAWLSAHGTGFVPGVGTVQGAWAEKAPYLSFFLDSLPDFERKAITAQMAKSQAGKRELINAANSWQKLQQAGLTGE